MSPRRRFRKQKFIDKKQQLRFAMELGFYALLFPLFFLVLSLADPIANQLMGNDTEKLQPLYSLLSFCIEHWWEFLFALGLPSNERHQSVALAQYECVQHVYNNPIVLYPLGYI